MVEIYLKSNTNYSANGDITLVPTQCTYKDSEQELTLTHFLDKENRWKYIEVDNVISVLYKGKKLRYRIHNVIRSLYKVVAYARPIFLSDLVDKILIDVRPTNKTGQEALDIILAGTGFKGHSNISTTNTAYYVKKNVIESLFGDDENSFISRWGGEYYFENEEVWINDKIGSDNGVRVEFGYNLNEIEQEIDTSGVATRIVPIGYDGISLDGASPWVDSSNLNKYPHPKMKLVEFSDVRVNDDNYKDGFKTIEEAREELKKRCQALYTEGIDLPKVNYKIDMINLSNTTYYKDFKDLLTVNKGDTVTCYIPHLDIDVKARVIDFERDMLTGEYISIELGNALDNYIQDQVNMQHNVNKVSGTINSDGTLKADLLSGVVDAHKTIFKATKDVAQPQDVLGMIFEDRVEKSPTFGCVAISAQGLMMASKYVPGTTDWDFRTFGTGKGLVADTITSGTLNANLLKTGTIRSADGSLSIDLNGGAFKFSNSNGELIIDNSSKIHKIVKELSAEIKVIKGAQATETVAHNLGYRPAYSAFQMGADGSEEFTTIPALSWSQNGATALIRARVDSKNFYFDFMPSTAHSNEDLTIKIKVFVYKEVAF